MSRLLAILFTTIEFDSYWVRNYYNFVSDLVKFYLNIYQGSMVKLILLIINYNLNRSTIFMALCQTKLSINYLEFVIVAYFSQALMVGHVKSKN